MFERLPTVPTADELIDRAFRRGSKDIRATGSDAAFVGTASSVLSASLSSIVKRFPTFEKLPEFYYELADIIVGVDRTRISLARVSWAAKQIRKIAREYRRKPGDERERRSALGRMASVLRSVNEDLLFLNEAAVRLRAIPSIDTDLPTLIIAGYPNGEVQFSCNGDKGKARDSKLPFHHTGAGGGPYQQGRSEVSDHRHTRSP